MMKVIMSRINTSIILLFWMMLFIFSTQACCAPQTKVNATRTPPATETPFASPSPASSLTPTSTAIPTLATPTNFASPMPTLVDVSISAVNGNLFIRRGPDLAFNEVGALIKGETTLVLARDALGEWVEVVIPSQPNKTGWASVKTKYAEVYGNLMRLPARAITDRPVAAYVRNCTSNEMFLLPGEFVILPLSKSPQNEISVNPGFYKAYDSVVSGHPMVLEISISEGITVDIEINGTGVHHKCP
jgi:hypothetical protein